MIQDVKATLTEMLIFFLALKNHKVVFVKTRVIIAVMYTTQAAVKITPGEVKLSKNNRIKPTKLTEMLPNGIQSKRAQTFLECCLKTA